MARKTEQQMTLEEQKRFYMACMRKARIHKQRMDYAKLIAAIDAQLYTNPAQEAITIARAAKLQMKAQKVAAAQAKETEAAELERLKEVERQKVRDEANPVIDHVKRAAIRAKIHQERAQEPSPDGVSIEVQHPLPETLSAPEMDTQPVVVSPELNTITREAEESAKRQSSTVRDSGLFDFFKKATPPLESRDVTVPVQRTAILTESSAAAMAVFMRIASNPSSIAIAASGFSAAHLRRRGRGGRRSSASGETAAAAPRRPTSASRRTARRRRALRPGPSRFPRG